MSKESQACFATIGAIGFALAVLLIIQPYWTGQKASYQCPTCQRVFVRRYSAFGRQPPGHRNCVFGCELGTAERFDPPITDDER